jgi:hypothetical protein
LITVILRFLILSSMAIWWILSFSFHRASVIYVEMSGLAFASSVYCWNWMIRLWRLWFCGLLSYIPIKYLLEYGFILGWSAASFLSKVGSLNMYV